MTKIVLAHDLLEHGMTQACELSQGLEWQDQSVPPGIVRPADPDGPLQPMPIDSSTL